MPQYGRGIQEMIDIALSIEDRAERQHCAETIIEVMANMSADNDNEELYKSLWDHLAYMSDYQLDVDYPYEITRMDDDGTKPARLSYPKNRIYQRQYGVLLERSVQELASMPDSQERDELMGVLANRMKQSLCDWNRNAMDENKVVNDMARYTDGRIMIPNEFTFAKVDATPLSAGMAKKKKKK